MDKRYKNTYEEQGYCPPLNYELSGRSFELGIDGGTDISIKFSGNTLLSWRSAGKEEQTAFCKCLKIDETTYFVSLEPEKAPPHVCRTFTLDLENMLVTLVTSREASGGRILTDVEFGAVRSEEGSMSSIRHGYTSDLVGSVVRWTTGPERACVHGYCRQDACRIECACGIETAEKKKDEPIELPAAAVRLKEGVYLLLITGQCGDRQASQCWLQDYNRVLAVGRIYRPAPSGFFDGSEYVMFGAYGRFIDG